MKRRERMNGAIAWMAKNPVAANLIMFGLIAFGVAMAVFQVRKEVQPKIEVDAVRVSVPYPGASPEEVEKGIILAIEEVVRDLDGVKEVSSTAYEGYADVNIQLDQGVDRNKALADVKNAVDRITTIPQDAERPIVRAPEFRAEAIWLVFYGDTDPLLLRKIAERARAQLIEMDDISYVTMHGQEELEIAIEVPQNTLRKYGITLAEIAQKIRQTAREIPAGGVKTKGGEILLRTAERRYRGEEFADIPIITSNRGAVVRLGDIATITDGFRESDISVAFEGKNVVWLRAFSVGDQSPPEVAAATKRFAKTLEGTLPPGVGVTTWLDRSQWYSQRLDLMRRNAMVGLTLVLIILGLFLEPRVAFWVTMGIPVAFLGTFVFMPAIGVSLNMISMFAFIIVLGMVVDDAIVVGENIYRLRCEGKPPLKAAVQGAREVAMPVFFSIATTIAAFFPLLLIPGAIRDFVFAIPAIVIVVLALSLVESFFILPAHLAQLKDRKTGLLAAIRKVQAKVSSGLERFISSIYAPFIHATLRNRWIALAFWIAIFTACLGLQAGGFIKASFMPEEESPIVSVNAKLPFGVPVEETVKLKDRFISAVHRVIKNNGGEHISEGVLSVVGDEGSHTLQIWCMLVPSEERSITSKEFVDAWREAVGDIPGLQSLSFNSSISHNAKPIDIQLSHAETGVLESAAQDFAEYLRGYKGVKDVEDGIERGKAQLDFKLSEDGINAGFTTANVATQVRSAFFGYEALRQQRGRDEMRVMVKLPRSERESLANIDDMILMTPTGGEMPLKRVAKVAEGQAYSSIQRMDGKRILRVKADVVKDQANAAEVMAAANTDYLPQLIAKYPGLTQARAGEQKEEEEFMQFLMFGFAIALVVMYGLIAVPLRSYLQPIFVVMIAIPFGFIGAILGHILLDLELCIFSWLGLVALSGVVVNDSIVFVDAANRFRREGHTAFDSAAMAAKQRFRPILLTSLTTFGGLSPMIFETSVQARLLIPMAVSLGFGVLMSTLVILTLVPSMFLIIENFRTWWGRLWGGKTTTVKEGLSAAQRTATTAIIAFGLIGLSAQGASAQTADTSNSVQLQSSETVSAPAVAEDVAPIPQGDPLTLAAAIRLADERNISLNAARTELEGAEADLHKAWGGLLPVISGGMTLTHLDKEDTTDFGGQTIVTRKQDTLSGALDVAVPLINPPAWMGVRLSKRSNRVSELTIENVRQTLLLTVARAYYQALTAKTLIQVTEAQIQSISRHLEVAKTRLRSGIGKRLDVIRAQSDLVRTREQLVSAHAAFSNARDTLGILTGIGGLPMPIEDNVIRTVTNGEADLIATGLKNREDIQLKKAISELTHSQKNLSWMQFLPSLNASWQLTHQFTEPVDPGADRTRWTAFLVLSIPIYSQTRYADLDKDRAAMSKATLDIADSEQNAALEIRNARRTYESAVKKVATAKEQADLARESLMLTQSEYIAGTGSSLAVTDARRSNNEAEINLAAKRFEAQIALLDLLRATGADMARLSG
ncbi:MAG: efflux RND transporter permease subunit [Myxococcota bacterium]|nr:efflux RND transporter permease subunit [Myxococcota bacterium]